MSSTWFSRLDEKSKDRARTEIADIQKIIKEMRAELKKPITVFPAHTVQPSMRVIFKDTSVVQINDVNEAAITHTGSKEDKADVDTILVDNVVPLSGLNMQLKRVHDEACKTVDKGQRWSLFQTQCMIKGKACKLMIDGGSCTNGISKAMVASLGLSTWRIPDPKHLEWLNSCGMLKVTHKVRVPFTVGDYVDVVECDVLPLEVCGLLLGRPWQYDRNVTHAGRANTYSFVHDGKQQTLKPMKDDQIKSDVELVVHKERLSTANRPRLATLQHEANAAQCSIVDIASAIPVDDKPVVLVSDKPVEVQPLSDERKDVAACVTIPVCVDTGVQTDDICVDHVPVHEVLRGDKRSFVSTPVRRFVGAAVRMHKGKDGHVRQLCGPGITHLLQGSAKQVHVQKQRAPAKVDKKKVVAPMPRRVWRRKSPTTEPSRVDQEGGCGVVGTRDLKMAKTRDAFVDITPPFPADPHALRTTLFEGGRMIRARRRR